MNIREMSTAGTPTSTVSVSASPSARPTGMKSQPTCGSIANSAGRAYCGGMSPSPIRVPRRTPTTCAMTAPGPSTGDRIGMEQKMLIAIRPSRLLASGSMRWARASPRPVSLMMPISRAMNAMNGRMLRMTVSMVSRPAW